ncbi:MAG: STN domain-containing protein [Planctomycetes bacterium]|nr:STN domain-containing protein [Planctomycetota bacterium]
MNRSGTAIRHLAAALLGLGAFAAATTAAQPPRRPPLDPLGEAVARQKIADQKAETDVIAAIQDASSTAKTNPVKAVQQLKRAQVLVDSPVLSAEARTRLLAILDQKIAGIEGRAIPNPGVKNDPIAAGVKFDKKTAFDNYISELNAVKAGVQRIVEYKKLGQNKEADREVAALVKAYPNNPSVINLQAQNGFGDRVQDSVDFAQLQQSRINIAMKSVETSSLPALGDVEFPKDWKEKTARRLKTVELTEQEKKIIESLNKPVKLDLNNRPLDEALQDISNVLDQKLFIDKKSIDDLGIDLRKPVSLQANGVAARTALRQLLASHGLTFVIKDQVIQVVDVEKAKNMLVTRVYYLGDVVQGVGPFAGSLTWGPLVDFQQTMSNVEAIMKSIKTSIDPLSWKENGGPASVTFHFPSMSIIVRASAEVHAALGTSMGGR